MSKVIKACLVRQGFKGHNPDSKHATPILSSSLKDDFRSGSECKAEFTKETATSIYLETKEMVNELITAAEKRAEKIIEEAEKQGRALLINTQEECDNLRKVAYEEGRQQGYQESLYMADEEVKIYKTQTLDLISELGKLKKNYLTEHYEEFLDLVLHISRKIINTAIEFKPELISSIVKNVLDYTGEADTIILKVNPIHIPFLDFSNESLQDSPKNKVAIEPDSGIKPGDCIAVTDNGFIDAQIEEQLYYLKKILKDEYENAGL